MARTVERLRASDAVHAERERGLADRYGGFDWWADFIGWAVALFFTLLFAGIAAAIVGGVGYQLDAPVSAADDTAQKLGVSGLVGGLVAVFLGYLVGGHTAGRMARFDGVKNGLGVVLWTIVMALVLGTLGVAVVIGLRGWRRHGLGLALAAAVLSILAGVAFVLLPVLP